MTKNDNKAPTSDSNENLATDIETVVEDHYKALYRFAFSLTKNEHEASDLTQQAFLIYSTKGHTIKDPSKIKSWLFTTLYREFLGLRRQSSRILKFDSNNFDIEDLSQKQLLLIKKEDSSLISNALEKIEPIYKEVIVLYFLKDLTYSEISKILDIPLGTVMSRLSRAKKQLKSVMKFKNLANENTNKNESQKNQIPIRNSRKKTKKK